MYKNKTIKYLTVFMFIAIFTLTSCVYAAGSFSVSANKTSLNPGGTASVTIKTNNCAGKFNVSSSNASVATVSTGSTWVDGSTTITVTAKANGTANIIVTPVDVSDTDLNDVTGSKSVTIKVTTPSNNTNTTKPSNNNNNNTSANKNNTSSKSSNANLKNMILNVEGLSPAFAKNITSYSLKVGENVDTIKVNASVEHNRASYTVSGNTNLKVGENIVTVKVTAEDGTVKTYKITVLKSDDPVKSDATLSSIIIEDVDLGQAFDSNVTEYNAGDITVKSSKLNVFAYPSNDNAKVEILGNENLGIGEGKITIRVTSENGKVTKDYVISFNKLYAENNENSVNIYNDSLKASQSAPSLWSKIKNWYEENLKEHMTVIVLYVFVWVEFIQVVYLYEKLKKYEDLDKITVGKRINKDDKNKENKVKEEKPRRGKQNPVFPEENETENKNDKN